LAGKRSEADLKKIYRRGKVVSSKIGGLEKAQVDKSAWAFFVPPARMDLVKKNMLIVPVRCPSSLSY